MGSHTLQSCQLIRFACVQLNSSSIKLISEVNELERTLARSGSSQYGSIYILCSLKYKLSKLVCNQQYNSYTGETSFSISPKFKPRLLHVIFSTHSLVEHSISLLTVLSSSFVLWYICFLVGWWGYCSRSSGAIAWLYWCKIDWVLYLSWMFYFCETSSSWAWHEGPHWWHESRT